MPSFLQISTSRSAQETKAPSAHTVTICQIPPSCSGANDSPYTASGGLTLICQTFQVGPSAALHRIIAIPTSAKNIVVIPKKPTKNGPTQKSNRSPPMSVPPRTRYFLSKLSIAIVRSSACESQRDHHLRVATGSGRDGPLDPASSVPVRISSCHQDGMLGGVYGRVISDVFALRGPSSQLNRSVESRMKWITIASPNRNVKSATKARRGSNRSQIRHMIASLYVRYERATLATCWMLSTAVVL